MAYEADKVVVELIADNAQFDAANKASSSNFQQSMGEVQKSGAAAETAVGRFSSALKENRLSMNQSRVGMLEFQHAARGVTDQMAVGAPLTTILTSHLGELSEAVVLSGSAFGKLGAFLQGPWGIALTLSTVIVGKLISSFLTQKDSLEEVYEKLVKHKEQTALNAQAEDIWSNSIDGLIERSKKLNDELEKQLKTRGDLQREALLSAQSNFAAAAAADAKLETSGAAEEDVSKAQQAIHAASLALHDAQVLAGREAGEAIADITKAATAWADAQLRAIQVIQGFHPELAEKTNADEMLAAYYDLKDSITKAAAANISFNGTLAETNKLNNELANGAITVATYDQNIRELAKSLRDTTEAAKNAPKAIEEFKKAIIGAEGTGANRMGSSAAGFGQFMPSTWLGYFNNLFPQDSGLSDAAKLNLRSNREVANAVIEAATKDYISVLTAARQQITMASLYTVHLLGAGDARKLFAEPADAQTSSFLSAKVLSGNPFLRGTTADARAAIAKRIGDSSGAVSSGAAAIDQALKQQAQKEAEQNAAFTTEMDRLNGDLLSARKSQVKDALAQLDISEQEVRAEEEKRDNSYQDAVATGKLMQIQADQLKAAAATVAAEKLKALEIQKQVEIIKRQDDTAEREAQYREDDLKSAEEAATSQAQRRDLDLQILDILYQEKLAHLERLKLIAENNHDLQAQADLQAQIDQLPDQKARDRAQTMRGTMDPLEAWLKQVPHDAKAVTEALQGIAINGFDQIASSIAGVVTGTESLGQAFGNLARQVISDLIQMTIRMLIFRALSSVLGGGIPAPDLSMPSQVDLGAVGSQFVSGPSLGGLAAGLPHMASGGFGIIGGFGGTDNNLISINGQGVAWASKGEGLAIVPNNAAAASPSSTRQAVVHFVVESSPYFDGRVLEVTGPVMADFSTRASFGGAAIARDGLAKRQIHQLGSRG